MESVQKNKFDAIVIGSGISGGWAAKELCEAGLKTLVLERGRDVKHIEDYPTAMKDPWEFTYGNKIPKREANPIVSKCYAYDEGTEQFFVKDEKHPYVQEKPFDWIRGYQVGGKSLIWARQTQRWSQHEFDAPKRDGYAVEWPISYQDLAPFYTQVEKFVGISGNYDGIPSLPDGHFLKPWELNCVEKHVQSRVKEFYKGNRHVIIGRCAHLTSPEPQHIEQGRGQCQARNLCYRGCPYGAYFSSNSSTLPWAAKTGNLTLNPFSTVESILYDEKKQKAISVRVIDTQTHEVSEYFAKIIFVNAAALNTNLILLNSKSNRFPNGLGNDSGVLGHYIAFHNYRGNAGADFEGFEDSYYSGRRPTSAFMPTFRNLHQRDTDFLGGYMVAFSAARGGWNRDQSGLSFGEDYKEKVTKPGPWHIFMMMQGETIPIFENHVKLDPLKKDAWGIPQLVTSVGYTENDVKMFTDFHQQAREILDISGGKNISTWDTHQNPGLDIHEMGGVRMGKDPKTSMLNKYNQMHACKNVFVTDGACMTTVGNQNPSLTFMALTARAVKHAISESKKGLLGLLIFLTSFSSLFAQSTPIVDYDVVIYGATSAGVIAGYSAQKLGKKTLVIESSNHLGGLTSGGLGFTDIGNKFAVTGLARDYYRRIGSRYGVFEKWTFEPSVARSIFEDYIKAVKLNVWYQSVLKKVVKSGTVIRSLEIQTPSGTKIVRGKQFIDCTYEGDLMAMSGVSYTVGRESNQTYGETWNGVQLLDKHQFPDFVDPYRVKGNSSSGLLWGISPQPLAAKGSGDSHIQAYNFRICLTDSIENQIPITRPLGYDSTQFELLLRYIEVKKPHELNWLLMHLQPMPHRKTDINNSGPFSTDMIGESDDFAEASPEKRREIFLKHQRYNQSFLYFLGHDPRVPIHLRKEMLTYGYPKDEYVNHGNWSPQMYVREARRMIGEEVMTQAHCEGKILARKPIGMAAYTMDSHNCQRLVVKVNGVDMVKNEGDVQSGGFGPYPIGYGALVPKRAECTNLIVPVCLSASHIAYGSIRMEPVFMVLGQTAGVAAVSAINNQVAIQEVDVSNVQQILTSNPLLDGSKPEILIDDAQTSQVQTVGNWTKEMNKKGCYGSSLLLASPTADQNTKATFKSPNPLKGNYALYFYLPNLENNSTIFNWDIKEGSKKSAIQIKLDGSKSNLKGEWVLLGNFNFKSQVNQEVILYTKGANGLVPADAILWVPIK
jgi:choline dehydrogenase-like flavoprotein